MILGRLYPQEVVITFGREVQPTNIHIVSRHGLDRRSLHAGFANHEYALERTKQDPRAAAAVAGSHRCRRQCAPIEEEELEEPHRNLVCSLPQDVVTRCLQSVLLPYDAPREASPELVQRILAQLCAHAPLVDISSSRSICRGPLCNFDHRPVWQLRHLRVLTFRSHRCFGIAEERISCEWCFTSTHAASDATRDGAV
jgi:hypothetical protein